MVYIYRALYLWVDCRSELKSTVYIGRVKYLKSVAIPERKQLKRKHTIQGCVNIRNQWQFQKGIFLCPSKIIWEDATL